MTLTYEQLKNTSQYRTSNKLYFNKYPFVVRFFRSTDWNERYQNYYRIAGVKRWLEKNNNFDYRTRVDYGLSVYLADLDSLQRVYNKYYNEIEYVDGPLSEKHQTTLENEPTVSVRKRLFYNQYRYKISSHLLRSDMDKWVGMIELCEDSFEQDNYKLNSMLKWYMRYKDDTFIRRRSMNGYQHYQQMPWSGTGTVYLKNYDDLCTLHLMYKSIITSTTKVMLEQELE